MQKERPVRLLIINDRIGIADKLKNQNAFLRRSIAIETTQGLDDSLERLVISPPDLCLIHEPTGEDIAVDFVEALKEAGLRTRVVAIVPAEGRDWTFPLRKKGLYDVICWDGTQAPELKRIIDLSAELAAYEEHLRRTKEDLLRQLQDSRDVQERTEALSAEYAQMAENLALAKEELETLNQEKNKLFSIIAHDLRSPFNAMLGYTQILLQYSDTLSPEERRSTAETVHNSAKSAFGLLENLLEWSRLQMNCVHFTPEPLRIRELVTRTIDVLAPVAAEKSIDLIDRTEDLFAYGDPRMVETVIRNLINNAVKFTEQSGSVTLECAALENTVQITVTDTGIGMDAEKAAGLFDLSTNVSTVGTGGEKGTGLGLLMCKELVERNGGMINVHSTPGEGSAFAFTLPAPPEAG
ncbi:MAG: ATP-binding protein [Rhodospirillales bacterium]|nr:ATP-binding protein [Rhodospirillales bacterium]